MRELRKDYFIDKEITLYQNKDHFCFNTDTKLLAKFMKIKKGDVVLDIGTNNGALLVWADQMEVKQLIGVEVLKESFEVAKWNAKNFIHDTILINQPIQEVDIEPVDCIISNPPFFTQNETHPNTKMNIRQLGRVEINLSLEDLIYHASRLLKSNGRFYFVHRPARIHEIMNVLSKYQFKAKTIGFAYDSRDRECKSLLVEAIKEGQCNCQILPPIEI